MRRKMKFFLIPFFILSVQWFPAGVSIAQQSATNTGEPYQTKFFQVDGPPQINIFTANGTITVLEDSGIEGVKVELYVKRGFSLWSGSASMDNYRIIFQQQGDEIIASADKKRSGSWSSRDIQFNYIVYTPESSSTRLRSLNGEIMIDGLTGKHIIQNQNGNLRADNSMGELRLSTTNGSILMKNTSGTILLNSVAGNINLEKISGEVRVRTISGHISGNELSGTMVAATTSGNVSTQFTQVSEGIYLETISGNVNVDIPDGFGYDIQAKGLRFDDRSVSEVNITEKSQRGNTLNMLLMDGAIPVNLKSVSGKITIRQN